MMRWVRIFCARRKPWLALAFRWLLLLAISGLSQAADLAPVPALGLRVARGFRVSVYANPDLAHDIMAMAIDARGNVVVTGPGYIRTLLDPDGQRRATATRDFASTSSGGQSLCFDGNSLYVAGDGMLSRFVDSDGDGVADGPPERLLTLQAQSRHALRKGPDGAIYLLAGNDLNLAGQNLEGPMKNAQAGALFRLAPNSTSPEPIAYGFRNPSAFDFNFAGDVFAADSGTDLFAGDTGAEAGLFLPSYTPARVFHIAYAGHHGWRLTGTKRSWSHPDVYPDTVNALARLGPELLTGLKCYRHFQFPPRYRDGLFLCDWAFGRVYFLPLQPSGASYQASPEVFLEPMGVNGFTPTGLAVAPDGSLLISTGGRKTRGAVYRVEYAAAGNTTFVASNWWLAAVSEFDAVLSAPEPLEAWSRAWWAPVALRMGPLAFAEIAADQTVLPAHRVRAIEILTEFHGGLTPETAAAAAQANTSLVRARVAWSLGRVPSPNFAPIILGLAKDPDPAVRRGALEAMLQQVSKFDIPALQQALAANLGHPDKRLWQCAARLAAVLPDPAWQALWRQLQRGAPQARLTATLALLWRSSPGAINQPALEAALNILAQTRIPDYRLQALGLITLALGAYDSQNPSLEAYAGYEPAFPLAGREALVLSLRTALRAIFPSGAPLVDWEAARLLAILEDNDPAVSGKVLSMLTDSSSPTADFHYLTVLSRLAGPMPADAASLLANAIVSLDRKLAGREQNPQLHWTMRLVEITRNLLRREPALAKALLRQPQFANPAHVDLVPLLEGEDYLKAARLFLAAVRQNPESAWPKSLLELLETLPEEEITPGYRQLWANPSWRDSLTLKLAGAPDPVDRDKFLAALLSPLPQVRQASLAALLKLPRDGSDKALLPGLRGLWRACETTESVSRGELLAFLNRETRQSFKIQETGTEPSQVMRAYQPVFAWFAAQRPELWKDARAAEESEDPANGNLLLREVPWERGEPGRGAAIFRQRGCQNCHTSPSRLGPDLGGITQRLSLTNLFQAITYPSRQVAPPYRTTTFQMRGGQTFTGLIAFESPDVILLHTGDRTTVRLYAPEIISRQASTLSLMPSGLLNGLKTLSLADLYSYLQTLPPSGR